MHSGNALKSVDKKRWNLIDGVV